MATSPRLNVKRYGFGILTAALLSGAVALGTTTAVSQTAACTGDFIATTDSKVLASYHHAEFGFETTRTFAANIPAGRYDLNGLSLDGYETRAQAPAQTGEQWFVQVLDAQGNVLATSSTTPDLADGIGAASWAGGLGLVNLATDATSVRFIHARQSPAETNSVYPQCVGFTRFVEPTIAPPVTSTTIETAPPVPETVALVATPQAAVAGVIETARPSFTG